MSKRERPQIGKPTLKPADFADKDGNIPAFAVLVIEGVEYRMSQFGDKGKPKEKCVLAFKEFPDRELWIGAKAEAALFDHYGDDPEADWPGKVVPLRRVMVSVGGKQTDKMQVAEDWDAVLAEYQRRAKKGTK